MASTVRDSRRKVLRRIPVTSKHSSFVVRGRGPRIHADWRQIESAAWIAGSSPATTGGKMR
jgi:hypothetical protein